MTVICALNCMTCGSNSVPGELPYCVPPMSCRPPDWPGRQPSPVKIGSTFVRR